MQRFTQVNQPGRAGGLGRDGGVGIQQAAEWFVGCGQRGDVYALGLQPGLQLKGAIGAGQLQGDRPGDFAAAHLNLQAPLLVWRAKHRLPLDHGAQALQVAANQRHRRAVGQAISGQSRLAVQRCGHTRRIDPGHVVQHYAARQPLDGGGCCVWRCQRGFKCHMGGIFALWANRYVREQLLF